ncbi:MAG TPA: alpha/beta hydrolase [Bdellovibrionales bacterium]|nr:alpha/beta hydrolase [Bdellovibrionales bacterium]
MTQTVEAQFILIRGLARESRHWGDFPEVFTRTFKDAGHAVRVDGLDIPGCGAYSEMNSPITIHGIAGFLREKRTELNRRMRDAGEEPPKKVFLVAVSLGGMVATDWITSWPNDIDGAVFINTSFRGFSPVYQRLTPKGAEHLIRIITTRDPREREREVLRMVSNRPELHDEVSESWEKVCLSRPVSPENFARQLLAAATFRAPVQCPSVPLLILNSRGDRMVNPACSEMISRKWAVPLETHQTSGHDIPLDDPQWVAQKALDWYLSLENKRAKAVSD